MKKQFLFLFFILVGCILYGCNNEEDKVTTPPDDAPAEQEKINRTDQSDDEVDNNQSSKDTNQNGMQNGREIHFTSFDLDIDYADNKEFDVDYENDTDGMEAELKDTVKGNEHLQGDVAFNRISPV